MPSVVRRRSRPTEVPVPLTCDPDHAWRALDLVNEWVKHAEAKSGASLAAAGVVGGVLFNLVSDYPRASWWVVVPAIACGVAAVFAGVAAGVAIWPRLRAREAPTSLLYFNHIARGHAEAATYQETLRLLTTDRLRLTQEIGHQVWANSKLATAKYKWAGLSIVCLLLAVACLAITAAVIVWQAR